MKGGIGKKGSDRMTDGKIDSNMTNGKGHGMQKGPWLVDEYSDG